MFHAVLKVCPVGGVTGYPQQPRAQTKRETITNRRTGQAQGNYTLARGRIPIDFNLWFASMRFTDCVRGNAALDTVHIPGVMLQLGTATFTPSSHCLRTKKISVELSVTAIAERIQKSHVPLQVPNAIAVG